MDQTTDDTEVFAGERMREVTSKMNSKAAQLDRITEMLEFGDVPEVEPKRHTPEQAAGAILWNIEDLIRSTAAKYGLERDEIHRHVFRGLTLASFRMRDRPNDLLQDIADMAKQFKNWHMYMGSGCD